MVGDVVVELGQLFLQRLAQPRDAVFQASGGDAAGALAFGSDHLDDLTPAGHQIGQQACGLVRQSSKLRLGGFGKVRNHTGIDRIGLGASAERLRERPHLRRIDHHRRQTGAGQARGHHRLESAGCLDGHQPGREQLQPRDQGFDPGAIATDHEALAARTYRDVQPILRYIDAYINCVHPIPSLRKRAR